MSWLDIAQVVTVLSALVAAIAAVVAVRLSREAVDESRKLRAEARADARVQLMRNALELAEHLQTQWSAGDILSAKQTQASLRSLTLTETKMPATTDAIMEDLGYDDVPATTKMLSDASFELSGALGEALADARKQ